ncbi:TPA: hypothetical protein ACK3RK_007472 [Burkholderia cepacia]
MSFEPWGAAWVGGVVLPIVAAMLFKAKTSGFCVGAIGMAIAYAALGFANLSWLGITIGTGSVALDLWKQQRGER